MMNQTTRAKARFPSYVNTLLHTIYPLTLREKIVHRLYNKFDLPYQDIHLAFNPQLIMDLSPQDVGHQAIIMSGFYELALTRLIRQQAKKGGLFMDVGANYGYYSLLWVGENNQNKAIAFEASPENVTPLSINIGKNHFSGAIKIASKAVSDYTGKIHFSNMRTEGQTGWGGISTQPNNEDIVVPCITLDDYCEKYSISTIDFLKIDVEGADTMVLRGAKKMLKNKHIKVLAFEVNKGRMALLGIDEKEALDILQQNGYHIKALNQSEYMAWA